jgi:hypothetical protein
MKFHTKSNFLGSFQESIVFYQHQLELKEKLKHKKKHKSCTFPVYYYTEYDNYFDWYMSFKSHCSVPVKLTSISNNNNYYSLQPFKLSIPESWEDINQETSCSICLQNFNESEILSKTKCRHYYHEACIKEMVKYTNKCALCRTKLKADKQKTSRFRTN